MRKLKPCIGSVAILEEPELHFEPPIFLPEGYALTFGDHFEQPPGTLPDATKWESKLPWGPDITINNEEQYYTDVLDGDTLAPNPFDFDGDSNLIITAGLNTPEQQAATGHLYYSGVLTNFLSSPYKHGYTEARIKLPENNAGLWSAFWLLNRFYRPGSGATGENGKFETEIDWEFVRGPGNPNGFGGGPYDTFSAPIAYHYDGGTWTISGNGFTGPGGSPGVSQQCDGTAIFPNVGLRYARLPSGADLAADFHRFGIWWTADFIRWYLDGVEIGSICDPLIVSQIEMYEIINMAIGGNFPGPADPADYVEGTSMLVDYICRFETPSELAERPEVLSPSRPTSGTGNENGSSVPDIILPPRWYLPSGGKRRPRPREEYLA